MSEVHSEQSQIDVNTLWRSKDKYPSKNAKEVKKANKATLSKFAKPLKPEAPIIGELGDYQVDFMFVDDYAQANGGHKVIMNLINVQTRYLYSYLLKNKTEAANKLIEVIPTLEPKMDKICLDAGTEFLNKKLQSFLDSQNIRVDIVNKSKKGVDKTLSSYSLGIVERVNRTIRDLIERYVAAKIENGAKGPTKFKYQDVFDKLIDAYNNSIHSSIKMFPVEAKKALISDKPNENTLLLDALEAKKLAAAKELKDKISTMFPIDSYVRIKIDKSKFEKGAKAQFSDNVYKVIGHKGYYRVNVEDADGKKSSHLYHELTQTEKPKTVAKTKEVSKEIKEIRKEKNIKHKEKREDTKKENILLEKSVRERKPKASADFYY